MTMKRRLWGAAAAAATIAAAGLGASASSPKPSLEAVTSDGVTIYGERYFGGLDSDAPVVLLFHQGGSSARGEFASIASWLNSLGYRAIAWDLRRGGELFEIPNKTFDGLGARADEYGFCDAYPDLEAALMQTLETLEADKVVVLGSSYSAALVFQLAAKHPERVSGVVAFSPASGGPMADCRAELWADSVAAPVLALRPASEMEREPSVVQREVLETAGAQFYVASPGTHGASMLIDERVEGDAGPTRQVVADWLARNAQVQPH